MLAVDGFDMATLTRQQQDALDGWLRSGGVVIVGGGAKAAENFGFFEKLIYLRSRTVQSGDFFLQGIFT